MTRKWFGRVLMLVVVAMVGQALLEQLRRPSGDRTWQGKVAGVVPYDFRPPTTERLKKAFWSPEDPYITPHSFGVGWSVNLGRIVYDIRQTGRDVTKHAPGGGSSPDA